MSVSPQLLKPDHVLVVSVKTVGVGVLFGLSEGVIKITDQTVHFVECMPGFRMFRPSDRLPSFIIIPFEYDVNMVPIEPDDGKLYRMSIVCRQGVLEKQYCITVLLEFGGTIVRLIVCVPKNWEHNFREVNGFGVIAMAPRGAKMLRNGFL